MSKQYERIAADIRQQIQAGEHLPGERIPSEAVLAGRYKVSPPTLRQALGVLASEGLIEKIHGRGNYVRRPRHPIIRTSDRHQWEKDQAREPHEVRATTGATEHDTGLDMGKLRFFAKYNTETASEELATVFDVSEGTRLLHRTYRTSLAGENVPVSLIDSYLVYDLVASNPDLLTDENEPWPGGTQHQLFTVGIELDRIKEDWSARPPRGDEAELLELGTGVAVLVLRKTSIDTQERVVEYSEVVMPGDRTVASYTIHLTRWDS